MFKVHQTVLSLSVMAVCWLAAPNLAVAITDLTGGSPPFVTLCDGQCGSVSIIESRRLDAGFEDEFSLGIKLTGGGGDLTIKSDGNILLFGPFDFSGTNFIFQAGGAININTGDVPDTGVDLSLTPGVIILGGRPFVPGVGAGAGSSLRSSNIDIHSIDHAGLNVVSAVTSLDANSSSPVGKLDAGFAIYREGDIYVELANIDFENLTVIAGNSIVITGSSSTPVPEPSTAMLFGLGLTILGVRRGRLQ